MVVDRRGRAAARRARFAFEFAVAAVLLTVHLAMIGNPALVLTMGGATLAFMLGVRMKQREHVLESRLQGDRFVQVTTKGVHSLELGVISRAVVTKQGDEAYSLDVLQDRRYVEFEICGLGAPFMARRLEEILQERGVLEEGMGSESGKP